MPSTGKGFSRFKYMRGSKAKGGKERKRGEGEWVNKEKY